MHGSRFRRHTERKESDDMDRLTFSGTKEAKSDVTIRQVINKLAEYEDLEEQGKLIKLPCVVGDTVYVIPSKTNYKLNIINGYGENNRVYEQVVNRIEISGNGYLIVTCDGAASVIDEFYKKTWFLTKKEAEAALAEMDKKEGTHAKEKGQPEA